MHIYVATMYMYATWLGKTTYRKWGKIRWAKHSCFSRFSSVPQKISREYKCLFLIILNNKHFWPRQRERICAKTSMGLKTQTFSPANLSPSTVFYYNKYLCAYKIIQFTYIYKSCWLVKKYIVPR